MNDILADAERRMWIYLGLAAVLTIATVGFTAGLLQRAQSQADLMMQLRVSEKKANAANEMKTRFLANVSHELRTPLNGILGFAEMLKDLSEDAEAREFGGVIHGSALHLHGLVDQILDLAKMEAGKLAVKAEPVAIRPLLAGLERAFAERAQGLGLALTVAADPGCPDSVIADSRRLQQVLANLIDNALKFTASGSVAVSGRADGGQLCLSVADTGSGIAPDLLATINDRSGALGAEFTRAGQGAGLGLPLARELARLMGGDLQIVSQLNRGTTVTVTVPVAAHT